MGNIKKILSETIIGDKGLYDDHTRLEIQEAIHFHYRDGRYILKKEDFLSLFNLFNEAYKNYIKIGMPESTKEMVTLANVPLTKSLHNNRFGIELDYTNTIHIHYRDLRLHLTIPDYHQQAESFNIGNIMLNLTKCEYVNITDKKIRLHPIAKHYIKLLEKYDNNEYTKEEPENLIYYYMLKKEYELHSEQNNETNKSNIKIDRSNGFPEKYPGKIPYNLNIRYLFSLYESIKQYGYSEGSFFGQYIIIYKENPETLYVKDSHRIACLLHLNYTNIRALITEPDLGWKP